MTITVLWFPWGREIWLIHSLLLYGITILGGIYVNLQTTTKNCMVGESTRLCPLHTMHAHIHS